MPEAGVKLLNLIVRPKARNPEVATETERLEYAAGLIAIGAAAEGTKLLSTIDSNQFPDVLFFRASAHFARWEYLDAIPLLQQYTKRFDIGEYHWMVGMVNLSAALLYERRSSEFEEASQILSEETRKRKLLRLHGNCLELLAQNSIQNRNWGEASRRLAQAESFLSEVGGYDLLFVQKWSAILALLEKGPTQKNLEALAEVKRSAIEQKRWETVRHTDQFKAVATQNHSLLQRVFFGTPFASFRLRLVEDFGAKISLPSEYLWGAEENEERLEEEFDLNSGISAGGEHLKPGCTSHRLLLALCSDFYRPSSLVSLHAEVWPDSFYNPISSPNRVHQGIHRLKEWMMEHMPSWRLIEKKGFYLLKGEKTGAIRVTQETVPSSHVFLIANRLRERWSDLPFSAKLASEHLGISVATAQRVLNSGQREGIVEKLGRGNVTKYRVIGLKGARRRA